MDSKGLTIVETQERVGGNASSIVESEQRDAPRPSGEGSGEEAQEAKPAGGMANFFVCRGPFSAAMVEGKLTAAANLTYR